jgi:uncharacterized protein YifE (UPF0438 family)
MKTFETILLVAGKTATGIEVPTEIVSSLNSGKKPAVKVNLNGYEYRSTIAVMGGKFMIPVSAEHRTGANIKGGDSLKVSLELDTEPRILEISADLAAALEQNEVAKAKFEQLSYSQKRLHTLSVEGTKNPETRAKRVLKAIETLVVK